MQALVRAQHVVEAAREEARGVAASVAALEAVAEKDIVAVEAVAAGCGEEAKDNMHGRQARLQLLLPRPCATLSSQTSSTLNARGQGRHAACVR